MNLTAILHWGGLKAGLICLWFFAAVFPAKTQDLIPLSEINSPYDEQHPVLSPAGNLFFTRAFHPENQNGSRDPGDVWMGSHSGNGIFKDPSRIESLSTRGFDLVLGFLDDSRVLVYHDGKEKKQGIHQYFLKNNSWEYGHALDLGNSFRNRSQHFSGRLSGSKDILILSYSSFGSYGNEDIYVSFLRDDNHWTKPKNLGPSINTSQQELTPFLSADSGMLFFSTNGHGSRGGIDIFYSERLDESWENWSTPIAWPDGNSVGAELAYFFLENPKISLLTSTQNSEGYGDILRGYPGTAQETINEKINPSTTITVDSIGDLLQTLDKTGQQANPIDIPLAVQNDVNKRANIPEIPSEIKEANNPASSTRAGKGDIAYLSLGVLDIHAQNPVKYTVDLINNAGTQVNMVDGGREKNEFSLDTTLIKEMVISAPGYLPSSKRVNSITFPIDTIWLAPASKGASMVLEEVMFQKGTAEFIDEKPLGIISNLAAFLMDNPQIKILVEGHTDNLGNAQLNKELSLNRAARVRKALMDLGVEFERIRIAGWGGSRPIGSNQTEMGRIKNRRVELVIVDQ